MLRQLKWVALASLATALSATGYTTALSRLFFVVMYTGAALPSLRAASPLLTPLIAAAHSLWTINATKKMLLFYVKQKRGCNDVTSS